MFLFVAAFVVSPPPLRTTALHAGFGAPPKQQKKTYVTAGRTDLEKQWKQFIFNRNDNATDRSLWVKVPEHDWLLVGAVNSATDVEHRLSYGTQKALIAWCAAELHIPVLARTAVAEYGLGPSVDDEYFGSYDPNFSVPLEVEPLGVVKTPKNLTNADVGFKPYKNPLIEQKAAHDAGSSKTGTRKLKPPKKLE